MEVLALSALLSVHCVLHEGQAQCVASFHEDRLSREPQAEVRERERVMCWWGREQQLYVYVTGRECSVGTSQAVLQPGGCLWEPELCVEETGGGVIKMEVQGERGVLWRLVDGRARAQ